MTPREQVGAGTGERYDFQYHQAAADSLRLLSDAQVICVYCEWHDDYVIELADVVSYQFHQVKTRLASKGPWTLNEFFGIKRPPGRAKKGTVKAGSATTDSIFARLLEHESQFGARCERFVFVSDAGITDEFATFLAEIRNVPTHSALSGEAAANFGKVHAALLTAFPCLAADGLFSFLRRLYVQPAIGTVSDLRACRTLIGGRIHEMSEVNLTMSEAQKIGSDLVAGVRDRSHRVLSTLPSTLSELRQAKGIVVDDVLRVLSLSTAGYRELKSGGRDAVVSLSRLHRLCKRSSVPDALIPDLCRFKTTWESWWRIQGHLLNSLDLIALKKDCADLLRVHADDRLDFNGLRAGAKALAEKFAPVLTSKEPLTEDLVFGLMMALAVEAEQ